MRKMVREGVSENKDISCVVAPQLECVAQKE